MVDTVGLNTPSFRRSVWMWFTAAFSIISKLVSPTSSQQPFPVIILSWSCAIQKQTNDMFHIVITTANVSFLQCYPQVSLLRLYMCFRLSIRWALLQALKHLPCYVLVRKSTWRGALAFVRNCAASDSTLIALWLTSNFSDTGFFFMIHWVWTTPRSITRSIVLVKWQINDWWCSCPGIFVLYVLFLGRRGKKERVEKEKKICHVLFNAMWVV